MVASDPVPSVIVPNQPQPSSSRATIAGPDPAADAQRVLGQIQLNARRYNQAQRHYRQALHLYQNSSSQGEIAAVLQQMGSAAFLQGDTSQARLYYLRALATFTRRHSPAASARIYDQLGELYGSQQQWNRALSSYGRALGLWQKLGWRNETAGTLTAMGLAHQHQHQYSRALYSLRRALRQAQQVRDSTRVGEALGGIAGVYQKLENQAAAAEFYGKALDQLPRNTPAETQARLLEALAVAQRALGNHGAAARFLQQALPLAQRPGAKAQLSRLYQLLADLYRREGNYPQAFVALTRYAGLQDTLFAEQQAAQLAGMRYETELKERKIQLLTKDQPLQQAKLRRQTVLRNALGTVIVLLLILATVLYRSRQNQTRVNRLLRRNNVAITRQKEELVHLNKTKDTLFSIISHDLRSPLSSLYSLLTLLNIGKLPPERLAAHTSRLSTALNNTLTLLDNLLNWSASQMQGSQVRPEVVRLDTLVEEAVALLLGDAERKTIVLLNQVPTQSLVQADLNMMRLVVRNLLSNAIKFTAGGGVVTVSAGRQGKWWEVVVADTGVGIAVADREKVFGRYGPHSTPGTAREKGTGLGLQLCKDFVERNGGQIYFESQSGMGTTFRFTLPVTKAESGKSGVAKPLNVAAVESKSG
ncbi:tetratricopeptide repeat-containing sensor histidine kinase [Hymenobacter fastidiosus]|uniref:tetratricopeptide repeat-containing sensor histidine kinase n=1 Tax=Hymenobacter fastidiosus TaxID=486264 RepID=UPI0031E56957